MLNASVLGAENNLCLGPENKPIEAFFRFFGMKLIITGLYWLDLGKKKALDYYTTTTCLWTIVELARSKFLERMVTGWCQWYTNSSYLIFYFQRPGISFQDSLYSKHAFSLLLFRVFLKGYYYASSFPFLFQWIWDSWTEKKAIKMWLDEFSRCHPSQQDCTLE